MSERDSDNAVAGAIREQEMHYMHAYRNRDPRSLVTTVYATDAQLLPPGQQLVAGTDDITQFFQDILDSGVAEIELETVELDVLGATAVEIGRATLSDPHGAIVDIATFMNIWKRGPAGWQISRDIYKSDQS